MQEDKITLTLTDDVAQGLARIPLAPADAVKLKIYETKKLLAQAEADVAMYKAELAELRK